MDKITKVFTRANAKHWNVNLAKIIKYAWNSTDKDLKITIEEATDGRGLAQNRLLWLWHNELSNHINEHQGQIYGTEIIHIYVVGELLPKHVIETPAGPEIERTQTKKLGVKAFAEFLTKYDMWATDKYKCQFTHPEDLYLKAVMKDEQ